MTKLPLMIKQFTTAVNRLQEALDQEENSFMRDASIQRFEFCFDLAWKTIKTFLNEEKGIVCHSPKDCFRQAYAVALIEKDEFWIEMTDMRNQTVHTYREETAKEVYGKLPQAMSYFQTLIQELQKYNGVPL